MTDSIQSVAALNPLAAAPKQESSSPKKIKEVAQQFEALMIGELLKTSREAGSGGWMGTGDDQTGQTAVDMAEQQFASVMAKKGGLGLTGFITHSLEKKS